MRSLARVLSMLALVAPAHADVVRIEDPDGGKPNILRLKLNNREHAVWLRMKYADITKVDRDKFTIRWDSNTHYTVNLADYDGYDDAREMRLQLVEGGDKTKVTCPEKSFKRSIGEDRTTVRIPRKCIRKAEDALRAKGKAWNYSARGSRRDDTAFTPYADRG